MKGYSRRGYTLPAKAVTTIEFNGVNPNYWRINNSGATRIYAGVISMPTSKMYDFRVEPNQVRMYCKDKGYPKLYIYNPSSSPIDIIIEAFIAPYSVEVLAFCDFNVASSEDQTVNVEIGGFTQSLPQGQNHIGKITVADQPDELYTILNQIFNKIGQTTLEGDVSVDMTSTNTILEEIKTKTVAPDFTATNNLLTEIRDKETAVDMSATNSILEEIRDKETGSTAVETHLFSHEGDISYGEYWSRDLDVREVVYMSNDGEADIMLTLFDKGEAVTMTLKAGESIDHITGKFTSIGVDTSVHSVTIPYRLVFKYV